MREYNEDETALIDSCIASTGGSGNMPPDDYVQEAWIGWCHARDRYDESLGDWRSYAFVVITRRLRKVRRKWAKKFLELHCNLECNVIDSPEVRDAISSLPKRQRQAAELVLIAGYTTEDAADEIGVKVSRLSRWLASARESLREIVGESD